MALVLSTRPTFKFKVTVKQPSDAGELVGIEFLGEFKRLAQPEVDAMLKTPRGDDAVVEAVFVGWSGVKSTLKVDGLDVEQDLLVTLDNRAALLAEPGVRSAIVRAWLEAAVYGPAKN